MTVGPENSGRFVDQPKLVLVQLSVTKKKQCRLSIDVGPDITDFISTQCIISILSAPGADGGVAT